MRISLLPSETRTRGLNQNHSTFRGSIIQPTYLLTANLIHRLTTLHPQFANALSAETLDISDLHRLDLLIFIIYFKSIRELISFGSLTNFIASLQIPKFSDYEDVL